MYISQTTVAGVKDSGTDPHIDPSATDAWNTAILGFKWWVLFDPDLEVEDVTCDPKCSSRMTVRDWYASVATRAGTESNNTDTGEKTTKTASNLLPKVIHVLQTPGETLYLPYGFVHAVYNLGDCIGVTANYAAPHEENRYDIWHAISVEGTVEHKRQFFWGNLNTSQRKELRSFARDEMSQQLQLPNVVLDGFEEVEALYEQNPTLTIVGVALLFIVFFEVIGMAVFGLSSSPSPRAARSNKKTIRIKVTKKISTSKQNHKKND